MAHVSVVLDSGLRLHSTGHGRPSLFVVALRRVRYLNDPVWTVARPEMDVHHLWALSWRPSGLAPIGAATDTVVLNKGATGLGRLSVVGSHLRASLDWIHSVSCE